MGELHVVPDSRKATWRVQHAQDAVAASAHTTAIDAKSATCSSAAAGGLDRGVVH